MKPFNVKKLVFAAMFLAVGLVLPLLTAQIKEIGDTLLPMHLPVLVCGLVCSPAYGGIVGLILPFLRSVVFGMPPLYPNAVWMALELAAYGLVIGLVYSRFKKQGIVPIYTGLLTAMVAGRLVWGVAKAILLGVAGKGFTMEAFWVGGFLDAIPGIVLQLILVPLIALALQRALANKK